MLDAVVGHEVYSFLDEFSGYNQIRMHPTNQEKTTFVTEWGVFVAVIMMFGLKTKDCPNNVLKNHLGNIRWVYPSAYEGISG